MNRRNAIFEMRDVWSYSVHSISPGEGRKSAVALVVVSFFEDMGTACGLVSNTCVAYP